MSGSLCGARQQGGVLRCDLELGHWGQHISYVGEEERAKAWENPQEERRKARRVGAKAARQATRVNPQSDGQAEREAFLAGVKAAWLSRHPGFYPCEMCGLPKAHDELDLHHADERRSQGRGFRLSDGSPGVDDPTGLRLICRSCHEEAHA